MTHQEKKQLATSVVDQITITLRNQIIQGVLVPGQRLVEADLTESLGVSRSSLREALRKLVSDGLLDLRHNRGITVRRLTKNEILDLLHVHEALACTGARLAALNSKALGARKALNSQWQKMSLAAEQGYVMEFLSLYPIFHDQIFELSGNQPLIDMQKRLILYTFRRQLTTLIDVRTMRTWHREHGAIIAAIESNNGKKAAQAMAAHIEHFIHRVELAADKELA
jgi:DNA-binding GntR family transcriptional regulator